MGRRPLRLLVIDDNRDAADSLAALLRLWRYEVDVAYDGPAGLEAAVASLPDVVLLDVAMPGMTGWQVAERLRELPGFGEVVLLAHSGYAEAAHITASLAAGCDLHLAKPADPDLLAALLAVHRDRLADAGLLGG